MVALPEYNILCPMRSVAKFVPVVPISSPRETSYDLEVFAIRFFYEICNEFGKCQGANV